MKPLIYYRIKGLFKNIGKEWDKLSPEQEEAIEFAQKFINSEPIKNVDAFTYSWEYVLAHFGEMVNEHYRKGELDESDIAIADMIENHSTKRPITVYRGTCGYILNQMIRNAKDIKGVDLMDKAFLQSSLVKGAEINSGIKLRIYMPTGTKAVYLGNVNDEQFYYEVVLQRATKLKIISIDSEYINCKVIEN